MKNTLCAVAVGSIGFVLTGCISTENDRITLGPSVRLEGFTTSSRPAADAATPALIEQTPTLAGLDRSNWARTTIYQPVDGTAHKPVYATRWHLTEATARQRRESPTALSALELTGGSEGEQQLEAVANPVLAATDLVLLPLRVIWQHPWATRWSPDIAWQRYWQPERAAPVNAPAVPAPEAVVP